MKYLKQFVLPLSVIIVSFLVFQFFRVMPASRLWNGYTVVYVPVKQDSSLVGKTFEEAGCSDYICLRNQKVPLAVSRFSPEYSFGNGDPDGYLEKRRGYFFDFSREYTLYYVPDSARHCIPDVIKRLGARNVSAGINSSSACPWMSIVVVLGFALSLVWFSSRRLLMLLLNFFPVYFTVRMPFYSVASASCIFMAAVFLSLRYWNRSGAVKTLAASMVILLFFISPLLLVFLTGLKVGFLFLLVPVSVLAAGYIYFNLSLIYESRYSFRPVLIRPASMIPLMNRTNRMIINLCFAGTFLVLVAAFFSLKNVSFMESSSESDILLPSKNASKKDLPGLDDYVSWRWSAMTFPYQSLNDSGNLKNKKGQTVVFPRYEEKNGKITESVNSITYDENFRKDSVSSIDLLSFNSIESMLKKQGYTGRSGYSGAGGSGVSAFICVLLVLAMLVPGMFCVRNLKKK